MLRASVAVRSRSRSAECEHATTGAARCGRLLGQDGRQGLPEKRPSSSSALKVLTVQRRNVCAQVGSLKQCHIFIRGVWRQCESLRWSRNIPWRLFAPRCLLSFCALLHSSLLSRSRLAHVCTAREGISQRYEKLFVHLPRITGLVLMHSILKEQQDVRGFRGLRRLQRGGCRRLMMICL